MAGDVTFLPVLMAGLANIAIGFIFYHPRVLGGVWMRLAGITPETIERGKRRMPLTILVALLAGMLMAYVMYHFGGAWYVVDVIGAIELAFWLWIGFVAPVMLGVVLWEGKTIGLYAINVSYWFIAMMVMSVILVL